MVSKFLPTVISLWLYICALQVKAFKIDVEPYKTNRPAPGETLFYNVVIEAGDPRIVDFILYNGDLDNSTIIFNDLRLVGDEDASGFDIPFVPPGKKYTGRLGRVNTNGREVLIESAPFEIWPVGTQSSSNTATSPGNGPTPTSSDPVSVATMTKLITFVPSSTPGTPAPTGGALRSTISATGGGLVLATAISLLMICI